LAEISDAEADTLPPEALYTPVMRHLTARYGADVCCRDVSAPLVALQVRGADPPTEG
jgi:hypothetical protein